MFETPPGSSISHISGIPAGFTYVGQFVDHDITLDVCPEIGLVHHFDQGCTCASEDYQRFLASRGVTCSMSRRGN